MVMEVSPPVDFTVGDCCCKLGMSIKGEWPEFECFKCPVHKNAFEMAQPNELCRRHKRERD